MTSVTRIIFKILFLLLIGCTPKGCEQESSKTNEESKDSLVEMIEMESTQPAQSSQKTVVFLGDSLTAGYGLSSEDAYPAKLDALFRKASIEWLSVNAGLSGDTTSGGLARIDWVMKAKPHLVVVFLGANDGLRGISLDVTESNLRSILQDLLQRKVAVVLIEMMIPNNFGTDYARDFKNMYARVAGEFEIPLLPSFYQEIAMNPDFMLPDGIHPNTLGTDFMAEKIYDFLRPILLDVAAREK